MPTVNLNPDRDFSADYRPVGEDLRDLLRRGEVAQTYDTAAQRRFGEFIGMAVFDPAKPFW